MLTRLAVYYCLDCGEETIDESLHRVRQKCAECGSTNLERSIEEQTTKNDVFPETRNTGTNSYPIPSAWDYDD